MGNFVSKHPYLTFILGFVAIVGVVGVAESATGAVTRVAGLPKKPVGRALPPKQVA